MLRAVNWRKSLGGGETRPQVFECDDGEEWALKLPGNPHGGVRALCADLIGWALARALEVPTIETQPVWVSALALSTVPQDSDIRAWMKPGTALGSRFLVEAMPVFSVDSVVESGSPREVARMVVIDTWLDVLDRKKNDAWNCLIENSVGTHSLKVYGLGLTQPLGLTLLGPSSRQVQCPDELLPYLDSSEVTAAIQEIEDVKEELIHELIRSIPEDWAGETPELTAIPGWLMNRRGELRALFA